jgi:hypothetical protein
MIRFLFSVSGFWLLSAGANAAPELDFDTPVSLCVAPCDAVGGVVLTSGEVAFLIVDGSNEASYIRIDPINGSVLEQTVLAGSMDYTMNDIAQDGQGGAWMVGTRMVDGSSVPGRWHSATLQQVEIPVSFDGNTDVSLLSVAATGAAFGVTNDVLATRIDADGSAVNLATGLSAELPTTVTDATQDGALAVGNARLGGVLTLALWDETGLVYQDTVTGGNGVVGRTASDDEIIVGLRVTGGLSQLTAIIDPRGTPTLAPIAVVTTAELQGVDSDGAGLAFGSIEQEAALFDLTDLDVTLLASADVAGFGSLVSLARISGAQWVATMNDPAAYALLSIDAPAQDTDEDGVPDSIDNCLAIANPAQVDADADQIGNRCDADFNNDCVVNFVDLGAMRSVFFMPDSVVDLNVDGVVNFIDLGILRGAFFAPPGPGVPGNACDPG